MRRLTDGQLEVERGLMEMGIEAVRAGEWARFRRIMWLLAWAKKNHRQRGERA